MIPFFLGHRVCWFRSEGASKQVRASETECELFENNLTWFDLGESSDGNTDTYFHVVIQFQVWQNVSNEKIIKYSFRKDQNQEEAIMMLE